MEHIRPLNNGHHKALLSLQRKSDIQWWIKCLDICDAFLYVKTRRPTVVITTDACNQGGGMTCDFTSHLDWANLNWHLDHPIKRHICISTLKKLWLLSLPSTNGPLSCSTAGCGYLRTTSRPGPPYIRGPAVTLIQHLKQGGGDLCHTSLTMLVGKIGCISPPPP